MLSYILFIIKVKKYVPRFLDWCMFYFTCNLSCIIIMFFTLDSMCKILWNFIYRNANCGTIEFCDYWDDHKNEFSL